MANEKYLKGRFQQKTDTSENWAKATNFVPLEGEIIVYQDGKDSKLKIGNNEESVKDLPFITGEGSVGKKGTGENSVIFNDTASNNANAENSIVFGSNNTILQTATGSLIAGTNNQIEGNARNSLVIGSSNKASGLSSAAFNRCNEANSIASTVFGEFNVTPGGQNSNGEGKGVALTVLGKCNAYENGELDNALFAVGNGNFYWLNNGIDYDIVRRNNALVVHENGAMSQGERQYASGAPEPPTSGNLDSYEYWRFTEALGTGSMSAGMGAVAFARASKSLGYRTQTGYPTEEQAKSDRYSSGKNSEGVKGGKGFIHAPSTLSETDKENINTGSYGQAAVAIGADTLAAANHTLAGGHKSKATSNNAFAFGSNCTASGVVSNATGMNTIASGDYSHTEGNGSEATHNSAHAEGAGTKAYANYSHAEGQGSQALGNSAHAEGYGTIAKNAQSHAEGLNTNAEGTSSHTEGAYTYTSGDAAHAEGYKSSAIGAYSHVEGYQGSAIGAYSHVEGNSQIKYIALEHGQNENAILESWGKLSDYGRFSLAYGAGAHSEGLSCLALGGGSHAEGKQTISKGIFAHSEGGDTKAYGNRSHAEGDSTQALANDSHAEGGLTIASGSYSHAEGNGTKATAVSSHAEGKGTEATANYAHAEGYYTKANGEASHAEGYNTIASNAYSPVEGLGTTDDSEYGSHIEGRYNTTSGCGDYQYIVGNGYIKDGKIIRSNSFIRYWDGDGHQVGAMGSTTGADYAEYFEWEDGNPNNEDRIGYVVALNGEKIYKATGSDDILGIISGTAAVIGDTAEIEWSKRFLTDEFGRRIKENIEQIVEVPKEIINNETGEKEIITEQISLGFRTVPVINPDWDESQPYTKRKDRPEWGCVGMFGKLYVRDDGTCQVNGYAKVGNDGVLTVSDEKTNMRVMSRVNDHVIRVLLK